MGKSGDTFLDAAIYRRALARWAAAARDAGTEKLDALQYQSTRARQLRTHLDRLVHVANERLSSPLKAADDFSKPHNTDWAWRPEVWRSPLREKGISSAETQSKLGEEITLFHDCKASELTLRQVSNQHHEEMAAYGLRMDVFSFDGSFLSLVLDLPQAAVDGLKQSHVLRVEAILEMEKPLEIFARLNIRHGPNTEQIVREFPKNMRNVSVEFDLAYASLNERRIDKAWIDLIFESPQMNQVTLSDLTFSRRPRAQL